MVNYETMSFNGFPFILNDVSILRQAQQPKAQRPSSKLDTEPVEVFFA